MTQKTVRNIDTFLKKSYRISGPGPLSARALVDVVVFVAVVVVSRDQTGFRPRQLRFPMTVEGRRRAAGR